MTISLLWNKILQTKKVVLNTSRKGGRTVTGSTRGESSREVHKELGIVLMCVVNGRIVEPIEYAKFMIARIFKNIFANCQSNWGCGNIFLGKPIFQQCSMTVIRLVLIKCINFILFSVFPFFIVAPNVCQNLTPNNIISHSEIVGQLNVSQEFFILNDYLLNVLVLHRCRIQ